MHTLCILNGLYYRIQFNHKNIKNICILNESIVPHKQQNSKTSQQICLLFKFLLINSAYKRNVEKLKGFWPDSSAKFTNSFASVTTWTPLPFSLSLSLMHTHTVTHTDAGKACRNHHTSACESMHPYTHTHTHTHTYTHTHTHTHTHTALSVYSTSLKMACSVGEILVPLCQQEIQMIIQILKESESQSCWVCLKRCRYVNLALVQCDVAWVHSSCASLELRIT